MGRQILTNGDLAAIHAAGEGYVFNWYTTGPTAAQYSLLHEASCRTLPQMFAGRRPGDVPRRKYFFDTIADARSWLLGSVGAEGQHWSRCRTCHAGTGASVDSRFVPSPTSDPALVISVRRVPQIDVHRIRFARPDAGNLQLRVKPELESFDRREAPGQRRLQHYLDDTLALLRPHYEDLGPAVPLALRLDVGLPRGVSLLKDRDLDNYLAPLARRLNIDLPGRIVTAWATKQHADRSCIRLTHASPAPPGALAPGEVCSVETTASSESDDFKEQIASRLEAIPQLPYGPLWMDLSFTVGPSRNWIRLWKPTIDALVPLLGRDPHGATRWSPLDGRITDLALHLQVDPALGNRVQIAVAAGLIQPANAEPRYRAFLLWHVRIRQQ